MTRLILATRNAGKITELRAILADAGLPHELVGADAYPEIPDVKETGVTFAENALLKAHALAQATGLPAVADDSGLCVDVLERRPRHLLGPLGRHARRRPRQPGPAPGPALRHRRRTPRRPLRLRGGPRPARRHGAGGRGPPPGHPAPRPRRHGGFGYDPILQPEGETRTCAELTAEEKNAISHRGQAFRALVPVVRELLG